MNTTPTATAPEKVSDDSISRMEPLTADQIRSYTRASLVGDMLQSALQKESSFLHLTLIQIVDSTILEFNEFLQGRAEALLRAAGKVEERFSSINYHVAKFAMRRMKGDFALDEEATHYRQVAHDQNWSAEELRDLESVIGDAFEVYANVDCFMRAVDWFGEHGSGFQRTGAPRSPTLMTKSRHERKNNA